MSNNITFDFSSLLSIYKQNVSTLPPELILRNVNTELPVNSQLVSNNIDVSNDSQDKKNKIEIEVRFGLKNHGSFNPGVSNESFVKLKNYLDENFTSKIINTTEYVNNGRKNILQGNNSQWQRKENITNLPFDDYNFRVNVAKEYAIAEIEGFKAEKVRYKHRYLYRLPSLFSNENSLQSKTSLFSTGPVELALTEVRFDTQQVYEVELEILDENVTLQSLQNLSLWTERIWKVLHGSNTVYSSLMQKNTINNFNYYINGFNNDRFIIKKKLYKTKPLTTLALNMGQLIPYSHLPQHYYYVASNPRNAKSEKKYLCIFSDGIYFVDEEANTSSIFPKSVNLLLDVNIEQLVNSIFVGELHHDISGETQYVFYIRDCLLYKNQDPRYKSSLTDRNALSQSVVDLFNGSDIFAKLIKLDLVKYHKFTNVNEFFSKNKELLTSNPNADLLYVPETGDKMYYWSKNSKIYLDFLITHTKDSNETQSNNNLKGYHEAQPNNIKIIPHVKGYDKLVPFTNILLQNYTEIPENGIAEFVYSTIEKKFMFERLRPDKRDPNFESKANEVVDAIKYQVYEETLRGEGYQLLLTFIHNLIRDLSQSFSDATEVGRESFTLTNKLNLSDGSPISLENIPHVLIFNDWFPDFLEALLQNIDDSNSPIIYSLLTEKPLNELNMSLITQHNPIDPKSVATLLETNNYTVNRSRYLNFNEFLNDNEIKLSSKLFLVESSKNNNSLKVNVNSTTNQLIDQLYKKLGSNNLSSDLNNSENTVASLISNSSLTSLLDENKNQKELLNLQMSNNFQGNLNSNLGFTNSNTSNTGVNNPERLFSPSLPLLPLTSKNSKLVCNGDICTLEPIPQQTPIQNNIPSLTPIAVITPQTQPTTLQTSSQPVINFLPTPSFLTGQGSNPINQQTMPFNQPTPSSSSSTSTSSSSSTTIDSGLSMLSQSIAAFWKKVGTYNIYRIGAIGDGNCLLHSILQEVSPSYRQLSRPLKNARGAMLRIDLAQLMTNDAKIAYERFMKETINAYTDDMKGTGLLTLQEHINEFFTMDCRSGLCDVSCASLDVALIAIIGSILDIDIYVIEPDNNLLYYTKSNQKITASGTTRTVKRRFAVILIRIPGHYESIGIRSGGTEANPELLTLFNSDDPIFDTLAQNFTLIK
jgi:hypothetical protein